MAEMLTEAVKPHHNTGRVQCGARDGVRICRRNRGHDGEHAWTVVRNAVRGTLGIQGGARVTPGAVERFWSHVGDIGSDGCWIWVGPKQKTGADYGVFHYGAERIRAHRASWMIAHGPIPEGLFVCHHCDNQRCVRPDHLFLGTHSDNMLDCGRKGRLWSQRPGMAGTVISPKRTHCRNGHPMVEGNLYLMPRSDCVDGIGRRCKQCALDAAKRSYYAKRKVTD